MPSRSKQRTPASSASSVGVAPTPDWGVQHAAEILENIAEGFVYLDTQWKLRYLNKAAELLLGTTRAELLGSELWTLFPGLVGTSFESAYRSVMTERQTRQFTAFFPPNDKWYAVSAVPAADGISVYWRDVTTERNASDDHRSLTEAADRQRRIYEAALSNTPDLVYVFDLQHRFIYANEALLSMWGKTPADSLGKTCLQLGYEPWHAAMHDREIEQVKATGRAIRGEVPFTGTNGRRIYDYIFAPCLGPDGTVVAVAGTTRDITDRQRAEEAIREQAERLVEIDKAKDAFLATLSHELRNPLAPLRSAAAILRSADSRDERVRQAQSVIERQVAHMTSLLEDLLNISRITQGKLHLKRQPVRLKEIIDAAIEAAMPLVEMKQHQLVVNSTVADSMGVLDPIRVSQILSNLLLNAAKYTDTGGRIELRAEIANGCLELAVEDNGIGLPGDALDRIFTMFAQVEGLAARSEGGLGIGLALVKGLVTLHGGTVSASSAGIGLGSTFYVSLPLGEPFERIDTPPLQQSHGSAAITSRILIADDNVDAADTLATVLRTLGHEVFVAHRGRAAVALARNVHPDVAILDIGMPDITGYQVAEELHKEAWAKNLRLIALTGYGQETDRQRAMESGFARHLTKPIGIDELEGALFAAHAPNGHGAVM